MKLITGNVWEDVNERIKKQYLVKCAIIRSSSRLPRSPYMFSKRLFNVLAQRYFPPLLVFPALVGDLAASPLQGVPVNGTGSHLQPVHLHP